MPILLASPEPTTPVTPPTPVGPLPPIERYVYEDHFPGLASFTWTGWDGSTWELLCRDHTSASGVALGRRTRGLHFPQIDPYTVDSPSVDGASVTGYVVPPREVFFPVRVWQHGSSQEWIEHDRRWWRSMLPVLPGVRSPGRLTVTAPNGGRRWLELHPEHKGDHDYDVDPSKRGWETYGVYLTAYRPFWTSDPLPAKTFQQGGSSGFFGGAVGGKGAPFVIGGSSAFGGAVIDNPGDEPAWPVWRLHGPFTQVKIGTPGALTTIVMDVATGESITVNTDPLAQAVTDQDGRSRYPSQLAGAPFSSIPPGKDVPLVAEVSGQGRIDVTVQPLYYRGW